MIWAFLLFAAPVPPQAGQTAWVGQTVFRRTTEVTLRMDATSTSPNVTPMHIAFRVLREQGECLVVRNGGQEVLLRKSDALRTREAIPHFTKLLEADPTNQTYLAYRGWAHREALDIPAALADYNTLVERYPNGPSWWNNRASIKITAGLYSEALIDLNTSLQLSDSSTVAYRNRGWVKWLLNKPADAIPDLNRSLDIGPVSATAYAYRGLCQAALGRHTDADTDTAEAVRREPENPVALSARAQILATSPLPQVRNPKQAVEYAESACRNWDWRTGQYLLPLAEAYAAAGRKDDARRALEAALRDRYYSQANEATIRKRLEELK